MHIKGIFDFGVDLPQRIWRVRGFPAKAAKEVVTFTNLDKLRSFLNVMPPNILIQLRVDQFDVLYSEPSSFEAQWVWANTTTQDDLRDNVDD